MRELMIGYMAIRMLSGGAAIGIEALANYFGGMGQTRPGMVANMSRWCSTSWKLAVD